MFLSIILMPLFTLFLIPIIKKKISLKNLKILFLLNLFLSFINSCIIFYFILIKENIYYIYITNWINLGFLNIKWNFLFDGLTATMLFVIIFISFCVHLYSLEYMQNDPFILKFLYYLTLFTFFMIILVTSGNYLQLFLGWEGVGFCSYLLINFWYTRIAANKAAIKALVINKIGDIFLLLSILIMLKLFGSLNFLFINASVWFVLNNSYFFEETLNIYINYLTISIFFLILGVCAKSAQIGLHTWLPDAMEGPTPVSALLHAATMVTAGIFLLLRSSVLLQNSKENLIFLVFIGGLTAFTAATIGLFQYDIKKIIAYSTCSQLGYMVYSCGLSNYSGSLFHLMNHAFFKALLFLSAGAIIHSMLDLQDIRKMGNLLKLLPFNYIMVLIGSLALMGIPFFTGYYSKDFIIEWSFNKINILSFYSYWLGIISACLTSCYSAKLIYIVFFHVQNSYYKNILLNKKFVIRESNYFIFASLIFLFFGSVFAGFFFKNYFILYNDRQWILNFYIDNNNFLNFINAEFLPFWIKILPFFFTLLFFFISLFYINNLNKYTKELINLKKYKKISIYFFKGYQFNKNYNYIVYIFRNLGYNIFKNIDKGFLENINVTIISNINKHSSKILIKNTKNIEKLIFYLILGICFLFILHLLKFYWNINVNIFIFLLLILFLDW